MSQKPFIAKTCLTQLSSVEEKIRNKGLRNIQKHVDQLEKAHLPLVSLGLYYFYWYSDKTSKQTKFLWDLQAILGQLAKRDKDLFWAFLKELLDTLAQKFVKIDVYRASKFLLYAKFLYYVMYGLDLKSVLFDEQVTQEVDTLEVYAHIWGKDTFKGCVLQINEIVSDVLMECSSRRGLLLQYIYTIRDLFKRLFKLKRFKLMKELFLFVKPLLNLTAFTYNKKMRDTLKTDFLESLFKLLKKRGFKARAKFAKFILTYAKSSDLTEINRNIFYDFLEKVEEGRVAKKKVEAEEEEEPDMMKELDQIDKELNGKAVQPEEPKKALDIKSLNIGQLVKRHYEQFTNEEDFDEEADEDFVPEEGAEMENIDLTAEAFKMMESMAKEKREDQEDDILEEQPTAEEEIVITRKNGVDPEKQNGHSIVKEEDDGAKVYEMDIAQFEELDLPELDVEEENGEFFFGGNMSFEEMKNKLPEYYFKSPKQKKKYFRKLTTKYKKNLDKAAQGQIKRKKIHFNLAKIQKKRFKQKDIINKS